MKHVRVLDFPELLTGHRFFLGFQVIGLGSVIYFPKYDRWYICGETALSLWTGTLYIQFLKSDIYSKPWYVYFMMLYHLRASLLSLPYYVSPLLLTDLPSEKKIKMEVLGGELEKNNMHPKRKN